MERLKKFFNQLKVKAKNLKKEVKVLYLAYKRPDVPWYAKLAAVLIVGYALSPIDLIPDFVPVFGYLDDIILIPLGISLVIKMIPKNVLEECRQQADEVFKDGKPKNWVAGTIIIGFWIIVIWIILYKLIDWYCPRGIDLNLLFTYGLLFVGSFIAAAISGAAGFGGALLLLPLLSKTIGTTLAVPILTIAQLIGNLSRAFLGFKQISWKPVAVFILGAIPMSILGAFSFVKIPAEIITRGIGLFIITFTILKYYNILKFKPNDITMFLGGGVVGLLSGLIGSAGPIGAALFLSLNLQPVSYIASEAVTAITMHITKTIIYQKYLDIGLNAIVIGLFMGFAMIIGTWVGKKIIDRMPKEKFTKFVGILMAIIGLQMLILG